MTDSTRAALHAARQGSIGLAYKILTDAIRSEDVTAAFTLAQWRMSGDLIRRDLGEAQRLYGIAANLGLRSAEPVYLALLATGAGDASRDWLGALDLMRRNKNPRYRRELELISAMEIDSEGNPREKFTVEWISSKPRIGAIRDFLTPNECEFLIEIAKPELTESVVVSPNTGALIRDPIRTSSTATFPFVRESPALHAINRRIASATGTSYEQGEPAQVLAYSVGDEYKPHLDALPSADNQRALTALLYLNDTYTGGQTEFETLDWAFEAERGDALIFANIDDEGRPVLEARHAGRPVISGEKFILSKWIRERPLDLKGPGGRPF